MYDAILAQKVASKIYSTDVFEFLNFLYSFKFVCFLNSALPYSSLQSPSSSFLADCFTVHLHFL